MFFYESFRKDRKTILLQRLIRRKKSLLRQLRREYQNHRLQVAHLETAILQKEILLRNTVDQDDHLKEALNGLFQQRFQLEEEKRQFLRHFQRLQISLAKWQLYRQYYEQIPSQKKFPENSSSVSG